MAARETALVTGASAGIGREIAEVFAREGFDLIVVARRAVELESLARRCEELHGTTTHVLAMDLLEPDAAPRLVARLRDDGLRVDILVNNAGLMSMGPFVEIEAESHERLLQLNLVVLVSLTRRLLPGMIERGRGRILNVASTSAFQPVPSMAVYGASKACVLSFSESLSEELKGTGVTVTALCPGITRTEMLEAAQSDHQRARDLPGFMISDVGEVARKGFEACLAGRAVVVPGMANAVGASLVRLQPRWVVRTVGGLLGRRVR